MTFLPIVERELRVAARRKSTRRLRLGITIAAIVVVAVFLLFSPLFKAGQAGNLLFRILTGYVFGFCLLAGVFVTSDCLSEEKRAGTLGLLFLTGLDAAGVVAGKFLARSLNPVLVWLAVLPVISLALLLGGVTGAEFWRMAWVLLNTLMFSLAVGVCVSAWSRDAPRALSATLGLVLAAVLLPAGLRAGSGARFQWLSCGSPWEAYLSAFDVSFAARPDRYGRSLLALPALTVAALIIAAIKLRVAWRDDPAPAGRDGVVKSRRRGRAPRRAGSDPVYWLLQANSGVSATVWVIAVAWAAGALGWQWWTGRVMDWPTMLLASKAVGFLLKLIFVMQVCRFAVEARRGGSLEVLLCTPVTDAEILRAHWLHLRRLFLWPVVVYLLPAVATLLTGPGLGGGRMSFWPALVSSFNLGSGGFFLLGTVTDFLALAGVGLWLALSLRKPALAPGLTVLCVLIPPLLLFFIPDIFYDVMIFAWARERLERGFRRRLAEQYSEAEDSRP
jgi:ABC-type transport system involved in cytochrome c biogenesis permease component